MRWFLGIALIIFSFGALPAGDSSPGVIESQLYTGSFRGETVNVFLQDFSDYFTAKVRVRTSSNSKQRIKNDRIFEIPELPGLVFLTCRIAKAYSETHIDRYLKLLFQYTILVNAP